MGFCTWCWHSIKWYNLIIMREKRLSLKNKNSYEWTTNCQFSKLFFSSQASVVLSRSWLPRPLVLLQCWWADSQVQKLLLSSQASPRPSGQRWRRRAGLNLLSIKSHLPSSPSSLPWHHKPTTLGSKTQAFLPGTQWAASLSSPYPFILIWYDCSRHGNKMYRQPPLNTREINQKE